MRIFSVTNGSFSCYTERDSRKDEAVVFIFIFSTSALLAWAVCKPWVEKWIEVRIITPYIDQFVFYAGQSAYFSERSAGSKREKGIYPCF